MANLSYIPSFYFYRFADAVSGPYTALNAYSSGIIDRNGNIKGKRKSEKEKEKQREKERKG